MQAQQQQPNGGGGGFNNFQPSAGARLGHGDLLNDAVHHPVEENHQPNNHSAEIHRAYTGNMDHINLVSDDDHQMMQVDHDVVLLRAVNPQQAYAKTDDVEISLANRHPQWGCIFFALVYPRVGPNVFRVPSPDKIQHVAIKKLYKPIIHEFMRLGGEENPYKEVARMQELGDNYHVLTCIEFLEDDNFLYIVTPRGCPETGTLKDAIHWFDSDRIMDVQRIHQIFCKILEILAYLEKHNINHHDLSPDNFLFLTPDNLVVFDLALSVRIPTTGPAKGGGQQQRRALITPQGNFGTHAWMCPEVYHNRIYDGVAMDLWGATIILYNLLTNQILYEVPETNNISFTYFVYLKGLSSTPLNERAVDLLHQLHERSLQDAQYAQMQQKLIDKATAHLNLSPEAIELLENLLHVNPVQRYTLAQAMESAFVRQFPYHPQHRNNDNNNHG